jgi:hypothetical protein
MAYIMVDIESDGPIPGDYSMISFGAVLVDELLDKTFYGKLKPISDQFIPEALAVSGFSRAETLAFEDPKLVMTDFADWIKANCKDQPIFISETMALTGCLCVGIFIILSAKILLGLVLKIWAVYTKALKKTCLRPLKIYAKPNTPTIRWTMPRAMQKRCSL